MWLNVAGNVYGLGEDLAKGTFYESTIRIFAGGRLTSQNCLG